MQHRKDETREKKFSLFIHPGLSFDFSEFFSLGFLRSHQLEKSTTHPHTKTSVFMT